MGWHLGLEHERCHIIKLPSTLSNMSYLAGLFEMGQDFNMILGLPTVFFGQARPTTGGRISLVPLLEMPCDGPVAKAGLMAGWGSSNSGSLHHDALRKA